MLKKLASSRKLIYQSNIVSVKNLSKKGEIMSDVCKLFIILYKIALSCFLEQLHVVTI